VAGTAAVAGAEEQQEELQQQEEEGQEEEAMEDAHLYEQAVKGLVEQQSSMCKSMPQRNPS
jgi:hypothetical protein